MGAVFRALDTRTGQQVAIKLLPAEHLDDLGLRASFQKEAQVIAGLEHEAIVPVYEFGEQDGQPYMVMQFMPNGSLADRLIQAKIPPEDVVPILKRICAAIDYAHEKGIIHGDLKPSNILFDKNDHPYLADFGIARRTTPTRYPSTSGGGTPAYISPEQALGDENIDHRSDIYSLGVILFEMLTGVPPFTGNTPLAMMLMHVYDPPPSLRVVDWKLPKSVDDVIQRALSKKPDGRYTSASDLFEAYQLALKSPQQANSADEIPAPETTDKISAETLPIPDYRYGRILTAGEVERLQPSSTFSLPETDEPRSNKPVSLDVKKSNHWTSFHLIALVLSTAFSILLAGALVAFLRVGAISSSRSTLRLTYDDTAITLTNLSGSPQELSGLAFQRADANGTIVATFQASDWLTLPNRGSQELQPQACYQLIDPKNTSMKLLPDKMPPMPDSCHKLQVWLAASSQKLLFWSSQDGSPSFQVLLDGHLIKTCRIADGVCELILPTP